MDALLPAVLGAAPQLGGATLLVTIVVLLLRREGTELERARTAYTAELARINSSHDNELCEKNVEIAGLRERNRALEELLDVERGQRRAAEDAGRHRAPEPEGGPSPWAG